MNVTVWIISLSSSQALLSLSLSLSFLFKILALFSSLPSASSASASISFTSCKRGFSHRQGSAPSPSSSRLLPARFSSFLRAWEALILLPYIYIWLLCQTSPTMTPRAVHYSESYRCVDLCLLSESGLLLLPFFFWFLRGEKKQIVISLKETKETFLLLLPLADMNSFSLIWWADKYKTRGHNLKCFSNQY